MPILLNLLFGLSLGHVSQFIFKVPGQSCGKGWVKCQLTVLKLFVLLCLHYLIAYT